MHISPDEVILYHWGVVKLNLTILTTWGVMFFLVVMARVVTSRKRDLAEAESRQPLFGILEVVVVSLRSHIGEIGVAKPDLVLPFVGTLFLFIATSNLAIVLPFYEPPTGSLSTTSALAVAVFFAVPFFGIKTKGLKGYLRSYFEPNLFMAPFHLIGEVSRTIALAVRLFGNVMSGTLIVAILLSVTPILFPIVMTILGLLTGMVQAYIFSVLATLFIAAGMQKEQ